MNDAMTLVTPVSSRDAGDWPAAAGQPAAAECGREAVRISFPVLKYHCRRTFRVVERVLRRRVHRRIRWALSGSHGYHHRRLGVASVLIPDGFVSLRPVRRT